MKKPECIIFDFGNVLAFFDHKKACRQLAALSRIKLSEAQIDEIHNAIFKGNVEEKYDTGKTTTDKFREDLRSRFDIPKYVPDPEVDAAWSDIFSPNETLTGLIPRLRAMECRLLLASNTNELHHKFFREQFREILEYFDGTVTSYKTRSWKPDPDFYAACLRKLNRMAKRKVVKKFRAARSVEWFKRAERWIFEKVSSGWLRKRCAKFRRTRFRKRFAKRVEKSRIKAENCVFVDDIPKNVKGAQDCGIHGILYISTDTLVMRLGELGIPILFPKGGDPQTRAENDRLMYGEKYRNWQHFDTLRWKVNGVVFATSALLFSSIARSESTHPAGWLLVLYGAFVLLCGWLMRRIDFNMSRNNITLRGVAAGIGDHSLPSKPTWSQSAAKWANRFLFFLATVAIIVGGGLYIYSWIYPSDGQKLNTI